MVRLIKAAVLITFLSFISYTVSGQNTRRAFKLLEKTDYKKANELFDEALDENPNNPAALFGMMLILADDSSSGFDLVEAWKNGSSLNSKLEQLTPDDLEYIGEYFYNTEKRHINRPVKKKIEYAVEAVESKLIKFVREENNLDLVYRVLGEFPDFRYFDNVIHIRNQLEFRKYEKMNTLEGYLEFLKKFPDAAQVEKAIKYRNRLAFENACQVNTPDSYKEYLKEYPDAIEINQAIKRLHAVAFEAARKTNTIQALDEYMATYPDALEIYEARQLQKLLLYEYAKKIQTLGAYNEFIRKYPEGQQYIDIFNLKSLDNGMRFLSVNPVQSNNILWARSFEQEETDELSACLTVDTSNNYLIGSTVFRSDTGFTDAWIIKVNNEGKMIWNKYVGEPYNDEVSFLTVNHRNEIIGAGYTWTGIDSASRESWIFKLGPDGTKLWSRKLGKMHITSLSASKTGSIYAGGYLVNDSLQHLYSLAVLNDQGKRLWARTYTGEGHIIHIEENNNGKIVLVGTNWCAMIDPKGYISSEQRFNANDSVVACRISDNGMLNILAVRDSVKMILLGLDASNKTLTEKQPEFPEIGCLVNSVVHANNRLIILTTFEDHQSINWLDIATGKIVGSTRLPSGSNFNFMARDRMNNLLIQACRGEIVLLKNSGITF